MIDCAEDCPRTLSGCEPAARWPGRTPIPRHSSCHEVEVEKGLLEAELQAWMWS